MSLSVLSRCAPSCLATLVVATLLCIAGAGSADAGQVAPSAHVVSSARVVPSAHVVSSARVVPSAQALLGSLDVGPGWRLVDTTLGPQLARLRFGSDAGATLVVRITPRREGERAFAHSSHFAIAHEGALQGDRDAAALALMQRVVSAVQAADDGSVALPAAVTAGTIQPRPPEPEGRARYAGGSGHTAAPMAALQLTVAALLLLLTALALVLRALPTALASLWAMPQRLGVATALAVAAGLRLVVPSDGVTMFMGYRQTDVALLRMDIPRYGAGVHLLHHLALQVLAVDHDSLVWVHRVCAILTLPLLVAFAARMSQRPSVPLAAAWMAGATPLLVHDSATESNLVPVVLSLWTAMWLLRRWLDHGQRIDALGGLAAVAYAMTCRPEQLLIAPLLAAAVVLVSAGNSPSRFRPQHGLGALAALCVVAAPQAIHALGRSGELHSGLAPLKYLPFDVFMRNVVFWPAWFPAAITLSAGAAVLLSRGPARRGLLALWAVALLWGGTYLVDLPPISVPRLMAGSATLVCAVAATGVPLLLDSWSAWQARLGVAGRWRAMGPGLVVTVGLLSAAATLPRLLRPSNQQLEEQMFRAALRMLPPRPLCVQRLGDHDPPYGGEVHRYHPDYLFRAAGHRVLDLRDDPERAGCRETVVLLGTRCYARDRHTPTSVGPNQSCQAIRERFRLEPLWQAQAPVQWDDPFDWWRGQHRFVVGVYRVAGAAATPSQASPAAAGEAGRTGAARVR